MEYIALDPAGWDDPVIDGQEAPWTDRHGHEVCASLARQIAHDLITHQRWREGDGQPVYANCCEYAEYLGDDAYDWVRCQTGPETIRIGWIGGKLISLIEQDLQARPPHAVARDLAEWVYRRMLGREMQRAADLRDELQAAIDAGVLDEDEPISRTVGRLMYHGYKVADLRRELAALVSA